MSDKTNRLLPYNIIILLGWTAGILIVTTIFWFLTNGVRDSQLRRTVNRALVLKQSNYRLGNPITQGGKPGGVIQLGNRYEILNGEETGVIFVFIYRGIPASCLAILDQSGELIEIIPLNNHSRIVMERSSQETILTYVRRIEAAEKSLRSKGAR